MPGIPQNPAKPQGWVTKASADGHHMVDLGRGPALSLSRAAAECKPHHQSAPGAQLGRLQMGRGAVEGKGNDLTPESGLESAMTERTTVDWGSRGTDPQSESHRETRPRYPGPPAGESQLVAAWL